MRILMTGATGLIGRELGRELAARGHEIVCLVRDPAAARRRLPFPARCHAWEHTQPVPPQALHGVQAVLHLAGAPVAEGRWTAARKELILQSRVLGTRQLVQAVIAHAPEVAVFVHGSASGLHGDRGDEELDAGSSRGPGFLADVVQAWEDELQPLRAQRPGLRVPVVRTGVVLAREGGALAEMLPLFQLSTAGRLGDGRQWMSWIHLEDIVRLFLHVLDAPCDGVFEGVAPAPVTNARLTTLLCRALDVAENLPVPRAALQALYGERAALVLDSTRLLPRATQASGFEWRFPTLESALADLVGPLRGGVSQRCWEQWLPCTPEALWPFFCDARNLEAITPSFLGFNVLKVSTPEIGDGTLIDYRLRLQGIPFGWRTRIESWDPPRRFVDTQLKGPYALWHHTHDFLPLAGGTLMRDTVRWRLPVGWLGRAVAGHTVQATVARIFAYRAEQIDLRFGEGVARQPG